MLPALVLQMDAPKAHPLGKHIVFSLYNYTKSSCKSGMTECQELLNPGVTLIVRPNERDRRMV